ncbi:MAG: hypothetical protein ACU0BK_17800 [Shimia sp.]|uniref:hypothetical protein n=1 Tax=Shimia sp. TaxID=1954381 RepID=UPI004058C5ED
MPSKHEVNAMRLELLRLLEGLEFYRSWRIDGLLAEKGDVTQDDLNNIVVPSSFFLDLFDQSKGVSGRFVIKEVQSWYSHTAGDLEYWRRAGGLYTSGDVERFLEAFQQTFGFSFWEVSGYLKKVANKVLRRGSVTRDEEFYALRELEADLSSSVITKAELKRLQNLLRDYEAQQAKA